MKKGDLVRIVDGSYAMLSDNGNPAEETSGSILINQGNWEILQIGKFPNETDNDTYEMLKSNPQIKKQINNVKLKSSRCPSRIAYSQLRFCYSVEDK